MLQEDENIELKKFLDEYDRCWQEKNIEKLKCFYSDSNAELIYFDNHKGNDTYTVDTHLRLVNDFFRNGKKTESGEVEPVIRENVNYFKMEKAVCICFLTRYKSFPKPAVRSTMYLEQISDRWKIKHVHCSFEPEN